MTTQTFVCRLFGGRDVGVSFDGTNISILGQSIAVASLPSALQSEWLSALGSAGINTGARGAFGGDNVAQAIGNILDLQPTWRNAVQAALATYVSEQTAGGTVASVETFNRQ
jgi:hypothetical protein